jgi:hypothetical protein
MGEHQRLQDRPAFLNQGGVSSAKNASLVAAAAQAAAVAA